MKLELLDAYNIRARLSASIILLAPFAVTFFFIFDEVRSFATSSVVLFILLAFTNYVPIMQRAFSKRRSLRTNYAAQLLYVDNETISTELKKRYYTKLSTLDSMFSCFENPEDSPAFQSACESAVVYLRNKTRDNHLVQEENINYGFCKNLLASKVVGIVISAVCLLFVAVFSCLKYESLSMIPIQNYLAFVTDGILLLFWIFLVTEKVLEQAGLAYAKTLVSAIDTLE